MTNCTHVHSDFTSLRQLTRGCKLMGVGGGADLPQLGKLIVASAKNAQDWSVFVYQNKLPLKAVRDASFCCWFAGNIQCSKCQELIS